MFTNPLLSATKEYQIVQVSRVWLDNQQHKHLIHNLYAFLNNKCIEMLCGQT